METINDDSSVRFEEEYIFNSRGMKLFTCRWLPVHCEPKALIFLCHGYAMESTTSMKGRYLASHTDISIIKTTLILSSPTLMVCGLIGTGCGTRLAKAGYGVYGMDYEGHGKSSGLSGYIPNFEYLVNDCSDHFTSICEKNGNKKKMRILMGESMGGAVLLLLHRKKPNYWDGAVLVAPMCKIADDIRPHPMVINVLTKLSRVIPTWKIIPTPDLIDVANRDQDIRDEIRSNPYCYKGKPRLLTGNQLLKVSLELETRLKEVSLPFLLVHGEDDKVTDPSVSKLLYESASSTDKTFKLYPGMWHSLIYGELPENIEIVFSDVINWLDAKIAAGNSRLEIEQKRANDILLKA